MSVQLNTSLSDESAAESASSNEYLLGPESEGQPVLSVVMPTLNEEEGITTCIEKVHRAVEELEVPTEIVISDSSTDRTPDIARELGAIVVKPDKGGYGYAYRYAFERVRGDYIVMGDADTTYDFEQIPRLLTHLEETGADMVMGSRLDGEIKPGAMPTLHQYIGNPVLTRFLNTFYGAGVSDAHSGFRIFTAEAFETMDLKTSGMEFASEMIMEAGAKDLQIEEVPIIYHEREGEETLDSIPDGWRHVRFMLVNAPGYLFSVPGVLIGMVGALMMGLAYSGTAVAGVTLNIHSMIFGSLLVIGGFHIASLGVFASAAGNSIKNPSDPITNWLVNHSSLEQLALVGVATVGLVSAGFLAPLVYQWYLSGFAAVSFTLGSLLAFTVLIIGLQSIFSAFFLRSVSQPQ